MFSDAEVESLFSTVAAGVLQDLAGVVLPGSNTAAALAPIAARVFFRAVNKIDFARLPALLDGFVRIPFGRAHAIVETQAARVDLDEDIKREAVKYLAAIPMTSRQALHRFDDGGHVTTLVSQVPRTVEQVERLMPRRSPRFQPGDKLSGYDYRLEMLLGQGGFAEVWKARHTELKGQPPVALKFCLDAELLPSLKQEIALAGRLQDEASAADADKDFVRLLGTAYSAEPPFLVYEYIDGGNLCGWLDSFAGAPPPPDDVVAILKMTARAMAEAHGHGIAHRDLKPANLLITATGRVKVGDFGIGRLVPKAKDNGAGGPRAAPAYAATDPTLLRSAYTPLYSDPMRDPAVPAGLQDDVYALGVIGYQLLVGNAGARMEGAWRRYLQARALPAPLIDIIETCVAPPEERYVDAGALLAALEVLGGAAKAKQRRAKAKPKPAPGPAPAPEPAPAPQAKARPAVKFCRNCGTRAPAARRYCTNCGKALG